MRHYELVTILSPMLSQDQAAEAWSQISAFITSRNGEIFQEQPWGTRRLAYPIHRGNHHFLEGNYRLIRFSTERPFNQALETFLRVDERVLRSLVVSIPEPTVIPDATAATGAAAAPAAAPPVAAVPEATPAAEAPEPEPEPGPEPGPSAVEGEAAAAPVEATPAAAPAPAAEPPTSGENAGEDAAPAAEQSST